MIRFIQPLAEPSLRPVSSTLFRAIRPVSVTVTVSVSVASAWPVSVPVAWRRLGLRSKKALGKRASSVGTIGLSASVSLVGVWAVVLVDEAWASQFVIQGGGDVPGAFSIAVSVSVSIASPGRARSFGGPGRRARGGLGGGASFSAASVASVSDA